MVEPDCPGGQETILAEQVGGLVIQLKSVLGGTEVSVIFVATPVQIVFGDGGFNTGTGLIMIAREAVGPGVRQLEFVP